MLRQSSRKKFSSEDDAKLKALVAQYGEDDWAKISDLMKSFSPRQCKERYNIYLRKAYRTDPWTDEEDALLVELYSRLGPKWCEISEFLQGRHSNSVKNRWYRYLQYGEAKKQSMRANQPAPVEAKSKPIELPKETNPSTILEFLNPPLTETTI